MPDYSKGKIYCIRSLQTDKVYVGSTVETLSSRMSKHRYCYKKFLNSSEKYCSSFEILKYEDAYIELIKLYPCSCKSELEREEGQYIREMNCVNKRIAGRTKKEYTKEYKKDNKVKLAIRDKKYREENKEKTNEKFKCECGGQYTNVNKLKHFKTKKHQKYLNEKSKLYV